MRTAARFPQLDPGKGHYESFYLKATRPDGGLGIWIRHTIHRRPGESASASVWVTLFEAGAGGPVATKLTVAEDELSFPAGSYIRVDGAQLEPARASAEIETPSLTASWELELSDEPGTEAFHHLPYEFLYKAALPRTKLLTPHPALRASGRARIGDREITLDRWPAMIGHNWGAEHAERWTWIQAGPLEGGGEGSWFDLGAGRIKLGPITTPWIANAMLVLDGEPLRLGGLDKIRSTSVSERPDGATFELAGKDVRVSGTVGAPREDFVAWVYADPVGPEHHSINCSISDLELTVERSGHATRRLSASRAAAYELGTRDFSHGHTVQPFGDG